MLLNVQKYVTTKNKSIVDVGAINILKYPTGIYTLIIELKDSASATSLSQLKGFIFSILRLKIHQQPLV